MNAGTNFDGNTLVDIGTKAPFIRAAIVIVAVRLIAIYCNTVSAA